MPYPHPEKRLPGASLKKCKPDAAQPFPPIRQARRSQPVHRPILLPFTGRRRSPAHRCFSYINRKKPVSGWIQVLKKYGRGDRI